MKKLILLFGIMLGSASLFAQQDGSITYHIDIDGLDAQTKSLMQNLTMVMTFKGKQSRTDMDMGMVKMSTITKDNITYSLMDYMGNKIKIPLTQEDVQKTKWNESDYTVDYTSKTKDIAGYPCNLAIIKTKSNDVFNVWYCNKLQLNACSQTPYSNLKGGCPMEFDMVKDGMRMKMQATKVDLGPVSDSAFIIPDGYQEISPSQLEQMRMMGGSMPSK